MGQLAEVVKVQGAREIPFLWTCVDGEYVKSAFEETGHYRREDNAEVEDSGSEDEECGGARERDNETNLRDFT